MTWANPMEIFTPQDKFTNTWYTTEEIRKKYTKTTCIRCNVGKTKIVSTISALRCKKCNRIVVGKTTYSNSERVEGDFWVKFG